MVQIISGKKGKGKTKYLLDSVNGAVASAQGSVVYLDKTAKHMYELSNKVRLINVSDYGINSYDAFIGFVRQSRRLKRFLQNLELILF